MTDRLVEGLQAAARQFTDLLLPPTCRLCGTPVASASGLCAECWAALPVIEGARCRQCGIPLPVAYATESHCLQCLREPPPFAEARAPYLYDGPARQMVLRLKNGRERWAGAMARDMARVAPEWLLPERILLPVPLNRWRLAERGYNQAVLLARALQRLHGAQLALDWLERPARSHSTRGLNRRQRLESAHGAYRLRPRHAESVRGARITLVDDVMTTGATASACAAVLRRAGAAEVDVLTYARVAADRGTAYLGSEGTETDHGKG